MKNWRFFLTFICIVFITGCSSFPFDIPFLSPSDGQFLLDNLNDEEKSKIICDKGIELYKSELEGKEHYHKLSEIQKYFETALRFNPDNEKAEEYLGKIENFVITKVEEKIGIANKLLKKEKPSEKDKFNLAYAVSKAYELDPENEEVIKLKEEIGELTNELVIFYLEQTKAERAKIGENDKILEKAKKILLRWISVQMH